MDCLRQWGNLCWLLLAIVVARTAGDGGAGSYVETVDGQLSEVTTNGVVTSVTEHNTDTGDAKQNETYGNAMEIIHKQLGEAGLLEEEDTADHPLRRRRSPGRQKRFMSGTEYTWPKGIVPFSWHPNISLHYKLEAEAAMTRWSKFTCIRFVPWVKDQTKETYGLSDESHVEISKKHNVRNYSMYVSNSGYHPAMAFNFYMIRYITTDRTVVDWNKLPGVAVRVESLKGFNCAAHQGNIRHQSGQYNSCCSRGACTHELGHTLGLWHEHQSFDSAGFMKLDWNNVPADMGWTYVVKEPTATIIYQYDTSNTMHYGGSAFRILYEDLRPLIKFSNLYYMYKDVSLYHDCKELHCSSFTQQCHNDGFVTLVDNVCTCLCPAGLDPATGCKTTIKQVTTNTQWPAGSYALLSPSNGCSDNNAFKTGSWTHKGKGDNSKSSEFHLAGSFDAGSFRYEFCVKEDSAATASSWEPGRYCILRVGGTCPKPFDEGFVQFDDAVDSPKTSSGSLPDGVFAEDTRMEFCCRDDGFVSTPLLHIPNTQPLVLLMNQNGHCQEIAGMRWTEEYMWYDSFPEKANKSGKHSYASKDTTFKMWFCHYVPENLGCGGNITLTTTNRQAVITSPNYPSAYGKNMECTWVIKAEDNDSRVLLNFDKMKITSVDGDCQDSLEIRYNLPGQPGIRFCGDGIARTIRSLKDTVVLTLRSDHHQVATDIGFNVTASLFVPKSDESFDPATKGRLYRGTKDYTRSMKSCLAWAKATNCLHHTFNSSDFGAGLDKNYCRNPDDTDMPWCYTDANCNRDYCDVSNVERVYDKMPYCSAINCSQSREQVLAIGCAAHCKLTPPSKPDKGQTCPKPGDLPDATVVGSAGGATYNLGDTVTYKCNTGNETLTRTCLSDGKFSPAGYVCGACADGFAFRNSSCYRYVDDLVDFSTAQSRCQALGAVVSSVKDKAEADFIKTLGIHHWTIWTGATDSKEEGKFVWEDQTPLNWDNWEDGAPNNWAGIQHCVEMYDDGKWNDIQCSKQRSFVCKYSLSDKQVCADRHPDCCSPLLDAPALCTQHPEFADQLCRYSCGRCQRDATPACPTAPADSKVQLTSPAGQTTVARGALVRYACPAGHVLTGGQLDMACANDGTLLGQQPTCQDPENIIQDSNDVELIPRSKTTSSRYAYTSVGSNLGIARNGVIKQWKFFSPTAGTTIFQVWRPNAAGGSVSFILVGENQVLTRGVGPETHDVQEADWIIVQPGDRIGLWEPSEGPRGNVPYDYCDKAKHPGDYGVTTDHSWFADFSPVVATQFSSSLSCRTFSFKAVIHPTNTLPAARQRVTSHVPLVSRNYVGYGKHVYMVDALNYHIPIDGVVSEWQFFVKQSGAGALQIWRPRTDLGERKYQLIGQNKVNVTVTTPTAHKLSVPEGERLYVQKGDVIAVLYDESRIGIPNNLCNGDNSPESNNTVRYKELTPDTAELGKVYGFSQESYVCRTFAMRAVVTPQPATPACPTAPADSKVQLTSPAGQTTVARGALVRYACPARHVLTGGQLLMACGKNGTLIGQQPTCQDQETIVQDSNDVELISRSKTTSSRYAYTSVGSNLGIARNGVIKQWKFFSPTAGTTIFQVWRPNAAGGSVSFILVGQNQVLTRGVGLETHGVQEADFILVQPGDRIGLWEPSEGPRGNVPYDYCDKDKQPGDYGVTTDHSWFADFSPGVATQFRSSLSCRTFSFKAVIHPNNTLPAARQRVTGYVPLVSRNYVGSGKCVYMTDALNYHIPIDGVVSEWQFFVKQSGAGALQIWRPRTDVGERNYQLIGQNKANVTVTTPTIHKLSVSEGERIAVKKGDVIAVLYDESRLGIPWNFCNKDKIPESNNTVWFDKLTPDTAELGKVYGFSVSGGSYVCRTFSMRAVVTPNPS